MDINQPSRVRSYTELKLLLAFNPNIDPQLRDELVKRLETVSINPMSNDCESEIQLAREQYDALVEFARNKDGLPAKIERDRREEMVPLVHGPTSRFFFDIANVVTLGRYVHRENVTPELEQRLELARSVKFHTQFLDQVARSTPEIEVAWDLATVQKSLNFLAHNATAANGSTAKVAARVFQRSTDEESRKLCLDVLSGINDKGARKEMLRIFREESPDSEWRVILAARLRKAVNEADRINANEANSVMAEIGGRP
jgi:hypothetical protein